MGKSTVYADFETKSYLPIERGTFNYLTTSESDIICLGYKFEGKPVEIWEPGGPRPDFIKYANDLQWYFHNAWFDLSVWNILGPKYNFPKLHSSSVIDSMALCCRYTFPATLQQAGEVLELPIQKDRYGKYLIKVITQPPFKYTQQEYDDFLEYCKTDVEVLEQLVKALPLSYLHETEQKLWEITYQINLNGLPIDLESINQIMKITAAYVEETNQLLPDLTDGMITKITQVQRITKWVQSKGIDLPNLQALTVERILNEPLPDDVNTVLTLRQDLGRSSIAKYKKLVAMQYQGRIYSNLVYHRATTGRWGGRGFQLHNLPRASVDDPQKTIDEFFSLEILENEEINPVNAAKALIRPMICAPKEKRIAALDFSAIENRLLAWVADDQDALELFKTGKDQYIDMAATLYGIHYSEVTKDQRFYGKVLILGAGYGLGWRGFKKTADSFGLFLSDEEAMRGINIFRQRYYKVKNFWYKLTDAAKLAVLQPGTQTEYNNCKFKVVRDRNNTIWLVLTLPSGRKLFYNKPRLDQDTYGPIVTAMGINPYSHKWQRLKIIHTRWVENVVQALARDILAETKIRFHQLQCKIIGSVHDEIILEVIKEQKLQDLLNIMTIRPYWCQDLPIDATGYIEKRYRKD